MRTPLLRSTLLLAALLPVASTAARGQQVEGLAPEATTRLISPADRVLGVAAHRRLLTQRFLGGRRVAAGSRETPAQALEKARTQAAAMLAQPRATALSTAWQPLGPTSIVSPTYGHLTGRISALALDPNNSTGNTLYVGTTGGGVWKSTNAAGPVANATFAPLTDTLPVFSASAGSSVIPSLSIGALAVQPTTNPVVLAGTGDPNDATDSLYGEGILRSTDGGLTWSILTHASDGTTGDHSFQGLATAGIAFSTTTPALVVAAFSVSPQSAIVDAAGIYSIPGLYYSQDAGQTWRMATVYDGAQIVQQPQILGSGIYGNAATSVVWDARRGRFFAALRAHGYYSSLDGITWTRLAAQPGTGLTTANCGVGANGQGTANCPIFRGTLAVQPATGDLYALTTDVNNHDGGLWQDLCLATSSGACATSAPTFSNRLDNGALEAGTLDGSIPQGAYNLSLAAVPTSAGGTLLFAGTEDLYRCSLAANATACTLRNTTNALDGCNAPAAVAPAQHALAAVSLSSGTPILFLGNDGGLWRSLDGVAETGPVCSATDSTHFDNLNAAIGSGGSLAEIIGFASDPTSADTMLAGLGANGTAATSTAGTLAAWPQLSAGEGGYPAIDPTNPLNWLAAIGSGVNLAPCTLGANCTAANFVPPAAIGPPQVVYDEALLDAPTLLDPAATSILLAGTCRVWRGPAAAGSGWTSANALSSAFDNTGPPCTTVSPMIRSLATGGPAANSSNPQFSGSSVIYAGLAGLLDGGGSLPGHLFVTRSANTPGAVWTDTALSPVTNAAASGGIFNPAAFDIASIAVDPHDPTGATVYAAIQGFGGSPHLYRSLDFGAHWINISANLPSAPANAVLVDPNSGNTVYVALDTGVYATTAVSSCPTTGCWSLLGTGLPNAPAVALSATPNLPTGDGRRGLLRVATYGRGIWQQPLLNAISVLVPALTTSPTSLSFSDQAVATESSVQTLTLTSSGQAPAMISSLVVAGDFTETDTCTGQTLPVGATCTVSLTFAPTATGSRSGQLAVYANINGGQLVVPLLGTGTAAADIVLTPLTLSFPATPVNSSSAAQIITVANTGGTPANLQTPTLSGDFSLSASTCGSTLAPQTACSLSLVFAPIGSGNRNGTLTIIDSAGTQIAQLTGTGNSPATDTLSASALTFAQQQIGTASASQQITLTNAGDIALTLITASISGSDFTVTNSCGNSLAAHSACALSIAFVPTAKGSRSATLSITDQLRTQTLQLTGSGIAPPGVSLSPTSLTFATTGVGLTAPAQILTLTNNGGLPLAISHVALTPSFILAANSCPSSLPVQSACSFTVVFAPTAAGPVSGTITLTDDAPSGTQITDLTGTSVDFTLAADGPTTQAIPSGGSASYALTLDSLASLTGNVALACSGAPASSTCTVSPSSPHLGSSTTLSVTVATGLVSAAIAPPPMPASTRSKSTVRLCFLGLFAPLLLSLRRRNASHRRHGSRAALPHLLLLLCAFSVALTLTGCGSGRMIPASPGNPASTPTPTGTYPITVTATAAGISQSVTLSLTVQ